MNLALNPFDRGKKPEVVDKVKIEGTENVKKCLEFYCNYDFDFYEDDVEEVKAFEDGCYQLPVLNPLEISILQEMCKESIGDSDDSFSNYVCIHTGRFFTIMLQKSYNAGNNNFRLQGDHIRDLCTELKGRYDRYLEVEVKGYIGSYFAHGSSYLKCKIDGDVWGTFGGYTTWCEFDIDGQVTEINKPFRNCKFILRRRKYTKAGVKEMNNLRKWSNEVVWI